MKLSIREKFSKFKRGMTQVSFLIALVNLSMTAFTAIMIATGSIFPWWVVMLLLFPIMGIGVYVVWRLGSWDFASKNKLTFFRKDAQVDPLTQVNIRMTIRICEKLGIDTSEYNEWLSDESKKCLGTKT